MSEAVAPAPMSPVPRKGDRGGRKISHTVTAHVSRKAMNGQLRPSLVPSHADGTSRLLHVSYAPQKHLSLLYSCCSCLSPVALAESALRASLYVAVYDTKIEFNEPSCMPVCLPNGGQDPEGSATICQCALVDLRCLNCCNGEIRMTDHVQVIYYDRHIAQNAAKAGCCRPFCTHNKLCISNAIVLYANTPPCCRCQCCRCSPCCRCCNWRVVDNNTALPFNPMANLQAIVCPCFFTPYYVLYQVDDPDSLVRAINNARDARLRSLGIVTGSIVAGVPLEQTMTDD